VKPSYSRRAWLAFELAFRPWMRRRLRGPFIMGETPAMRRVEGPLLLVANHVSWWDGFLLREVHRRVRPDAPFHVVMSAPELDRHPYFRRLGALPVGSGPMAGRGLLRVLEERRALTPNLVIGYFPQGRIWPSRRRPLAFRPGVAWLASRLAPLTLLPVGLHLEPLNRTAPAAFISVGDPVAVRPGAPVDAEAGVAAALHRIHASLDRYGEDAPEVWGEV
jgi:1-acyl-sn-glycerol-3-phosphate acyltransferase